MKYIERAVAEAEFSAEIFRTTHNSSVMSLCMRKQNLVFPSSKASERHYDHEPINVLRFVIIFWRSIMLYAELYIPRQPADAWFALALCRRKVMKRLSVCYCYCVLCLMRLFGLCHESLLCFYSNEYILSNVKSISLNIQNVLRVLV